MDTFVMAIRMACWRKVPVLGGNISSWEDVRGRKGRRGFDSVQQEDFVLWGYEDDAAGYNHTISKRFKAREPVKARTHYAGRYGTEFVY